MRVNNIYQTFGKLGILPNIAENATCKLTFRAIQPFLQLLSLERAYLDFECILLKPEIPYYILSPYSPA